MFSLIRSFPNDPLTILSMMQATTYLAASMVVRWGHEALWRCYALSALIYIGFAIAHHLKLYY